MITIGAIALALLVALIMINRFFFSWGGLVFRAVNLCKYKSIGVPTENARNKPLAETYDLPQIAAVMQAKGDYEVTYQPSGLRLTISRILGGVKNIVIFESSDNKYEFNLNTYNFDGYPGGSIEGGESCTTPSYWLEKRTYQMFDEMPLNAAQRAELKQNVRVINVGNVKVTF